MTVHGDIRLVPGRMVRSRTLTAQRTVFVVSCEHGGNHIPAAYRHFFAGHEQVLESHRGYDRGALGLAHKLADALGALLVTSTTSRLLIELNRSPSNRCLYSEMTTTAPAAVKSEIFARYYLPYRSRIESHIAQAVRKGYRVIHISSHSFTPVLDGAVRDADLGLLYDPARQPEAEFCRAWQHHLSTRIAEFKVRRNYPYRGASDGFTTYLRKRFSQDVYLGIEIEMNQRHVIQGARHWARVQRATVAALAATLRKEDETVLRA